jgi:acetyltransferase-like isoleucine patch superfamily enzyme
VTFVPRAAGRVERVDTVITMSLSEALRGHARDALSRAAHRGWRALQRTASITSEQPGPYRFRGLGPRSKLAFPVGSVFGEQWITVGAGCVIGEHVTLSAGLAPGHDLGSEPVVTIGDRCTIGRGSHIVGHASIVIADDVWTGPYIYITDQNHSYADPDQPIGTQWPINESVEIGAGSWLGAGAIILPGAKLGRNVVVAAGSVVRGTIPDHSVVAGVPAKIIRRHTPTGWDPPLRHTPTPLPDNITHDELVALLTQHEQNQ